MLTDRPWRAALCAVALGAVLAVAGCGDDDDNGGGGGDAAEAQELAIAQTEGAGGEVTFDIPTEAEAGLTEITYSNDTEGSREAQLVRVEGDRSPAAIAKALDTPEGAPTPDWLFAAGGTPLAEPGGSTSATQVLEEGTYHVVDFGAREDDDSKPTASEAFTVTGEADGELPETDVTIEAVDYDFEVDGPLTSGPTTLTFTNTGDELHHAIVAPLRPGATIADVRRTFSSDEEPEGPPPVDFDATVGTAVLDKDGSQVTELDLPKGKVALLCFISDREGGPPHVVQGMVAAATVE